MKIENSVIEKLRELVNNEDYESYPYESRQQVKNIIDMLYLIEQEKKENKKMYEEKNKEDVREYIKQRIEQDVNLLRKITNMK